MIKNNTIIALSTAQGNGAIAVIRLSGSLSKWATLRFFKPKGKKELKHNQVVLGNFYNSKNQLVDEVLVTYFQNPNSFTGEDVVEISCHNSTYIIEQIFSTFIEKEIHLATAGEFTQRAFLNGKLDLTQAEAVADLIASESKASHEIALKQMRGGFSSDLKLMREELINFVALLELELDFSEEDVALASRPKLIELIGNILQQIQPLINSFHYGNAIKQGIPIAIVGKPNAGKSTLLNALLNEERAIVSNIPGTTRDAIEERIIINGIDFRFIDTAGIRQTNDEIENLGIKKTFQKAKESKIILYLFDKEHTSKSEVVSDYFSLKNDDNYVIICPTKIDLYQDFDWEEWVSFLKSQLGTINVINISSKENTNLKILKNELEDYVNRLQNNLTNHIIVNQRHFQELTQTEECLLLAKESLLNGISSDWVSFHLREALKHLGNITGEIDIDKDILGTIFGKFCIGK